MKFVYIIVVSLLLALSCYKILPLTTSDEDLIECSRTHNYGIQGDYYIISEVDSIKNDQLLINQDNRITYYDYSGKGTWAIWDRGLITITRLNSNIFINSDLNILNGQIYICDNILFSKDLNIRFFKKY